MLRSYLLFIVIFPTPFSYSWPNESINAASTQSATSTFDSRDSDSLQDAASNSANQVGSDPDTEDPKNPLVKSLDDSESGSDSSVSRINFMALQNSCPSDKTHTYGKLRTRTEDFCSSGRSAEGSPEESAEKNDKTGFCPEEQPWRLCCMGPVYGWNLVTYALVDHCYFCKLSCIQVITNHNICAQMLVYVRYGWTIAVKTINT